MTSAGFEPAIPAVKWSHTYALNRMVIGLLYVEIMSNHDKFNYILTY